MTQAELYDSFPDGLKKAIRAYEPLEDKDTKELHDILLQIRADLDLPPWHPFTEFMKNTAMGADHGDLSDNMWFIRKRNDKAVYTDKKVPWVLIKLTAERDGKQASCKFAASPELQLVWSYPCEGALDLTSLWIDGISVHIRKEQVLRYAERILASNRQGTPHKFIDVLHKVKVRGSSKIKKKEPDTPTLNDILTPDPEAPKAIVDSITEADKEVLLTMLEMASLKLKELGMYSTLNRWRATVRRLTKHEIQTETSTESTSGTT